MSVVTEPTVKDPPAVGPEASVRGEASQPIDPTYLEVILRTEGRHENAPGADKSWVARMDDAFRQHYARARRI